jgi:hypothetical protein
MDRRRQRRFCTEVMGWSSNAALERHRVVIADISTTGCRIIDHDAEVRVGDRVVLAIAQLDPLAATVRWSRGDAAGLEFDVPLEAKIVLHLASLERVA